MFPVLSRCRQKYCRTQGYLLWEANSLRGSRCVAASSMARVPRAHHSGTGRCLQSHPSFHGGNKGVKVAAARQVLTNSLNIVRYVFWPFANSMAALDQRIHHRAPVRGGSNGSAVETKTGAAAPPAHVKLEAGSRAPDEHVQKRQPFIDLFFNSKQ